VGVGLLEQSRGVEVRHDALAGLEAVEATVRLRHRVVHGGIRREHVDHRQPVTLADLVVVEVVAPA